MEVMKAPYLGHTPWPRKCVRKSGQPRSKIKLVPRKQKSEQSTLRLKRVSQSVKSFACQGDPLTSMVILRYVCDNYPYSQ